MVSIETLRNMPDASYGTLVLDIRGGVVGCEQKSQGKV